jgi:hypothetical protein
MSDIADATLELLHHLAGKPGHDEVKADFRDLLVKEFGAQLHELDFERRVPEVAGRLDGLIGRTILEAKSDLKRELPDVERRMPDYLADRERDEGEPFVGIASDGKEWIVYELVGGVLTRIKATTLDTEKPAQFLAWLDGVVALKSSLPPDALTVRAELGHDSVAYRRVDRELRALWERVKLSPAEALKRQLWAELLKLVHGKDVENDALWFQHSYLVIVAKCIALAVMDLQEEDPKKLLSGEAFAAAGVNGAVESDFFDWVVAEPEGEALIRRIMAHVRRFRLREVESDVLKILYESLIDREERHGLGEYYTPDWLAAKVVRHAVSRPVEQKVLDPACGSGTFLFHAVRLFLEEAEDAGMASELRAAEACQFVAGIDIHPVAIIIARVTFLLALAPALANRSGSFSIPVYLGDSMQLSVTQTMKEKDLIVHVPAPPGEGGAREQLKFPAAICALPQGFDRAIEAMRQGSLNDRSTAQVMAQIDREVRIAVRRPLEPDEEQALLDLAPTYEIYDRLRREGRDTIWSYVARNLSRPLAFSAREGWANVLVGNPPWVAYRHMSADLQKRFKELARGEQVHVGGKFATQNDLCALFVVRASHLYLRPSGNLAFVMPLATMTRGQFEKFRSGRFESANIAWDEAWTMDDSVAPLFPVPSCAIFGRKRALGKAMPVKVRKYEGSLPYRDAPEEVADARLRVTEGAKAPAVGEFEGGSPYRERFKQGAILAPRMLCFVERQVAGRLVGDVSAPLVESRRSSLEKEPWRSVNSVRTQVEVRFLRPALLGENILPYRQLSTFEAVIPYQEPTEDQLEARGRERKKQLFRGMLTSSRAKTLASEKDETESYQKIEKWLEECERKWMSYRSEGSDITFSEQLDFYGKLSSQFPIPAIRVIYTTSGSQPASLVLRDTQAVVDTSLYWAKCKTEIDAHFLSALLNSESLRKRSEEYQARGQFGARHFHKVMWNLPIPLFDPKNPLHAELAKAGAEAEEKARIVDLVEGEKFQRARKRVRDALIEDGIAGRIDALVEKLLGESG